MSAQLLTPPLPYDILDRGLYYLSDELKAFKPAFFKGTSRTLRLIIKIKNIQENDILYVIKNKKNEYILETEKVCRAKLYISKEWIDANYFIDTVVPINNINNKTPKVYEMAPPIFELEDHKKFKDADENIIEIETRGERDEEKIYFKLKDISVGFGLPNLSKNIYEKTTKYEDNIDYKTFLCPTASSDFGIDIQTTTTTTRPNNNTTTVLFLTYNGLLHVLFASHSQHTRRFQSWASRILFTAQMGTTERKEELAAECLSVSVKAIRQVFNASITTFPCIYFIELGNVKSLRKTFNISMDMDNSMIIYKYGQTADFYTRFEDHRKDYEKMDGVKLKLKYFSYIDPKYVVEAETRLAHHFNFIDIRFYVEGRKELVIIDKFKLKEIEDFYGQMFIDYSGATKDLQIQIEKLKSDNEKLILEMNYMNETNIAKITALNCENDNLNTKIKYINETNIAKLKTHECENEKLKLEMNYMNENNMLKIKLLEYELKK